MRGSWHILRAEGAVTLARRLPARFDIGAHTWLGGGDALRLAHQIRQDLWRALRRRRGFSPVVHLAPDAGGWAVTAGGRAAGPVAAADVARVAAVLNDPAHRRRWLRHATRGGR
ncbi:MAG: hypothetical protein NXH82_11335 [Rhodobacteraceae bacterium]|nr:hypothetical protein [Paracoccaceae bacterium]